MSSLLAFLLFEMDIVGWFYLDYGYKIEEEQKEGTQSDQLIFI